MMMDIKVVLIMIVEALLAWYLLIKILPKHSLRHNVAILIGIIICCTARIAVIEYETLDYQNFLCHWVDYFRYNQGFKALKDSVGNYNIPYLYFLSLFSYSSVYDLYLIKLLSFFFDFFLALSSVLLLSVFTQSEFRKVFVFYMVLMLPTVFLNSAVWGQCDSIYTSFIIFGIYLALKDHPWLSVISFTLSLAFKLQAVFALPIVFVLLFRKKLRLIHAIAAPITYIVTVIPAVIAGRPFIETLTLYFNQTGSIGDGLNYNSSSVFAIIYRYVTDNKTAANTAIICAFIFMTVIIGFCFVKRSKLNDISVLAAALIFAAGIPFILPHMHDRYFFTADILSLILAFSVPETFIVFPLTQFASLLGYHAYLKMRYLLQMYYGAYSLIVVLVVAISLLFVSVFSDRFKHSIEYQHNDTDVLSEKI